MDRSKIACLCTANGNILGCFTSLEKLTRIIDKYIDKKRNKNSLLVAVIERNGFNKTDIWEWVFVFNDDECIATDTILEMLGGKVPKKEYWNKNLLKDPAVLKRLKL